MRIRITFEPGNNLGYSFELEGETWEEILEKVEKEAEKFDAAHDKRFGKPTILDRLLNR